MKTKLNWRLGKLPTSEEVRALVNDKLITNEEAREILFNTETDEERDKKSLESEIKFLRELVEKLSTNKNRVVEVIRQYQPYYVHNPWYQPYTTWCSSVGTSNTAYVTTGSNGSNGLTMGTASTAQTLTSASASSNALYVANGNSQLSSMVSGSPSFSSIKTF